MAGLADKIVLITGGSAGIGAATAKEFAVKGSKLVLVARRENRLQEVADACVELGLPREKILVIVADVTIEEDVTRIIQTTVDTFTEIHVLINNAGGGPLVSFESTTLEQFDQSIGLNLRSVFMMCKAALPYLIHSKGCIINVSTIFATRPHPFATAYCTVKAGLDHFTRNIAKELAPKGVRANVISPGTSRTEVLMTCGVASSKEELEKIFDEIRPPLLDSRVGVPEDHARAIVFLASDGAAYVTGTTIEVSGGQHLTS